MGLLTASSAALCNSCIIRQISGLSVYVYLQKVKTDHSSNANVT